MAMNKRAGFTLVELMIAMIAGAFAVAGVYYLNGVSARSYAQQQAVSDAQMSLRSAMEQIRRDVARAGYLAAPATSLLRNCQGDAAGGGANNNTSTQFQAVTIGASASGAGGSLAYQPSVNTSSGAQVATLLGANPVAADDLTMYGNFATADAYLTDNWNTSGTTITLQTDKESFRRSFFTPSANNGAAVQDTNTFQAVFSVGRMLRMEIGGRFFFRQIAGSAWPLNGPATITLATTIPGCAEETRWMAVAPVSRIHYGLESDLTQDFARLRGDATVPGSRRALLVRREEDTSAAAPAAGNPIISRANSSRVVLDYAVEFGVSAVRNTALAGVRPTWEYAITPAQITQLNGSPGDYRSLVVTISARAAEVDPRLGAVGAARRQRAQDFLGDPLLTFNVIDPNFTTLTTLQARVRTLRSEIFLHNL